MKTRKRFMAMVLSFVMLVTVMIPNGYVFAADKDLSFGETEATTEEMSEAATEEILEAATEEIPATEPQTEETVSEKESEETTSEIETEIMPKQVQNKASARAGEMTTLDISKERIVISASSVSGKDESGNAVTVVDADGYRIIGNGGANTITITGTATTIVLDNMTIDMQTAANNPMLITGGANVTLLLKGTNSLQTSVQRNTVLQVDAKSSLTIDSADASGSDSGKLSAKNINTGTFKGMGIGSSQQAAGGDITILGGTIDARGGAGIGGVSVSKITISGGNVTATGEQQGAGIGGYSGTCGTTIINGGTVNATGGSAGAGIGNGSGGGAKGSVTITGDANVTATGGYEGAGIGLGQGGKEIDITISGNPVITVKGDRADIGGGGQESMSGSITITGGTITTAGNFTAIGDSPGGNGSDCSINIDNASISGASSGYVLHGKDITVKNTTLQYANSTRGILDLGSTTLENAKVAFIGVMESAGNITLTDSELAIGYVYCTGDFTNTDTDITMNTNVSYNIQAENIYINRGNLNLTSTSTASSRYSLTANGLTVIKGGRVNVNNTIRSGAFTLDGGVVLSTSPASIGLITLSGDINLYDGYLELLGNIRPSKKLHMGKRPDATGGNAVVFANAFTYGMDTEVDLTNGIMFLSGASSSKFGNVYGDVTLDWLAGDPGADGHGSTLTIPKSYQLNVYATPTIGTLTIPNGKTVTVEALAGIKSNSKITVQQGGELIVTGWINNYGEIAVDKDGELIINNLIRNYYNDGRITGEGQKTNNGKILNEIWFDHIKKDNVTWTGYSTLTLKSAFGIEAKHLYQPFSGTETSTPSPLIWAVNDATLQWKNKDTTTIITNEWSWKKVPLDFYTLTFDGNYKNAPAITDSKVVLNGNNYVGSLATAPTRAGYTFVGWNTGKDGGGTQIDNETDSVALTGPTTLYAQWTAAKYTVKYDTLGAGSIVDKMDVKYDDENLLPVDAIKKDGFTFLGWKYGDTAVTDENTYESLAKADTLMSITLVAEWKENVYKVKYDTSFGDVTVADKEHVKWNDSNLLPEPPKKDGYGFISWELKDKQVTATDKYSSLATDQTDGSFITLAAKWVELTDYSVLYNTNGGSMPTGTPSTITGMKYGDTVPTPTPVQSGFAFQSWTYKGAAVKTGATYNELAKDDTIKRLELVAQWGEISYTVKYDTNGGNTIDAKKGVRYGEKSLLPAKDPVKVGYSFTGWKCADRDVIDATRYNELVSNDTVMEITLLAQWQVKEYIVKYDTQGAGILVDKTGVKYADASLLPTDILTKDGFTFLEWKYGDTAITDTNTYESLAKDDNLTSITLVAEWKENVYKVKYDTGFEDIKVVDKEHVKWNDSNLLPELPKKNGYGFIGWKLEDKQITATDKYSSLTTDQTDGSFITLAAKWVELTDYSVLYNTNGGSMPTDTPSTITGMKYDETVPIPTPIRDGFTFKGWTYKDVAVKKGSTYEGLAKDDTIKQVELVAQWTINKYTVDYKFVSEKNPDGISVPKEVSVEYGSVTGEPKFTAPANWTFDGWYLDKECTQKYDFRTSIKEDVTLYGKWTYKAPEKPKPINPTKPKPINPTKPSNTIKPSTPSTTRTSNTGKTVPQTGDNTNLILFGTLFGISTCVLLLLKGKRKKQRDS